MTKKPTAVGALTEFLRHALDTAEMVRFEGDKLTVEDVAFDNIDNLPEALDVYRVAQAQATAARQVQRVAAQQLAGLLGEGGAVGYGGSVLRYRRGWSERCIDPAGFYDYTTARIADGSVTLHNVFNADNGKKSWMDRAVRDTFFDRTRDPIPTLVLIPSKRVPQFLQHLKDGDVFVKSEPS